ncbi:hypothetical protein GCM10020367_51810 [Streptomyces sannanensis]|uniref:Probable transposase IS891/IS1136/IS1341 domain-containing protein n=1 Tax=Streptomyces sannanensis TaxID=285536 RepID=A0ABP6SI21_9ACTN
MRHSSVRRGWAGGEPLDWWACSGVLAYPADNRLSGDRLGLAGWPEEAAAANAYAVLKANLKAGNLGRPGSKRCRKATAKPIIFRPEGAQPYDDRMLSWQIAERRVSIWTVTGRMKDVAFTAGPEQLVTLALYRRGESDLVCRDGMWFLNATCEVPEPPPNSDPVDFLGIDLGIVNIATTSDGEIMAGRELNRCRVRERKLRAKLQKKNTPSAKRRLKKRGSKEARRARDINHKIAKHVVAEAMGVPPCSNEVESLGEHRSRDRPGGPDGHPRADTASQAPTGHPPQLVVRPAGSVHRVQGPPRGGAGGACRSGVHLAHLRRMRAHRQGEPGLPGLVRMPELRIR